MATERGQQAAAQAALDKLLDEKKSLEAEREKTLADVDERLKPEQVALETLVIKPRKADVVVDRVSLVWLPFRVNATGAAEAVYRILQPEAVADNGGDALTGKAT